MPLATLQKKKAWTDKELEALPKVEQVHIYRQDSIEALTRSNDLLSGGEVLPGFKCRLDRIFRGV
jgi:hypothetical protein